MLFSKKSILAAAFLLGLLFFTPIKVNASTIEDEAVSLINTERQKQNLPPVVSSDKLYKASLTHNNLMVDCAKQYGNNSCFTHTVTLLNEPTLLTRIKATGYNAQAVAENIAWGYSTSGGIIGAWMSSSGHRANIMGNYKEVGCSYVAPHWTCDFGRTAQITQATPTPTKTTTPTPTKAISITPTIIVSPSIPLPTEGKPWWCSYAPTLSQCK